MSSNLTLEVDAREQTGTNANRRLRASGLVPANVYGLDAGAFSVAVAPGAVDKILHSESGRNSILELTLRGDNSQKRAVMIREIQRDPLTEQLVHVDFIRVDLSKKVTVDAPINLLGTPIGVKNEGGILEFLHRTVQIECLPADIPDHLDVDVSGVHVGQHVVVGDLQVGEGIEVMEPPETVIANVVEPRVEEEPAAEGEGAEAAEAAEAAEGGDAGGAADEAEKGDDSPAS